MNTFMYLKYLKKVKPTKYIIRTEYKNIIM